VGGGVGHAGRGGDRHGGHQPRCGGDQNRCHPQSYTPPLLDATSGARSSVVRRCDAGGLVPHRRAGQGPASRPEPICRGQAQDGHGKSGTRPESRGCSPMAALAPIGHLQLPQHERECHASSGANVSRIKWSQAGTCKDMGVGEQCAVPLDALHGLETAWPSSASRSIRELAVLCDQLAAGQPPSLVVRE
jgi:hypothetical protein